jgi:hypothetical protein
VELAHTLLQPFLLVREILAADFLLDCQSHPEGAYFATISS